MVVCLGVEPGAAEWKAETNPLSYGGTHLYLSLSQHFLNGPTLASFYFYLKCKNVHLVWDLKSRPSDCESPPLTTRPGLFLSLYTLFKINNDLWGTTYPPGFLIFKARYSATLAEWHFSNDQYYPVCAGANWLPFDVSSSVSFTPNFF